MGEGGSATGRFILGAPKKCVGCQSCMSACLVKHFTKDDIPIPRIRVIQIDSYTTAVTCRHCQEAPCVTACPVGALYYDGDRVAVEMNRCIACYGCANSCPYGAITIATRHAGKSIGTMTLGQPYLQAVVKCDLCYDRAGGPACVEACTSDAIRLVERRELEQDTSKEDTNRIAVQI